MKTIYINIKAGNEIETIDQFTQGEDAPEKPREFRKYVNEMLENTVQAYRGTGYLIYKSQRCCKDWK